MKENKQDFSVDDAIDAIVSLRRHSLLPARFIIAGSFPASRRAREHGLHLPYNDIDVFYGEFNEGLVELPNVYEDLIASNPSSGVITTIF